MSLFVLRSIRAVLRRHSGRRGMDTGRAASLTPLCANFGYGRGTPIDRYYIERFLAGHAPDIQGHVLEIKDDVYSCRFGAGRVTQIDVLDVDRTNERATMFGDLTAEETLPEATFDCIILTQTIQFLFDLPAAVAHLRKALVPNGVLLITAPGISPLERGKSGKDWCWSLTETSLRKLLTKDFGERNVEVAAYGNLFAATAFLHGAALEDVSRSKLDPIDPAYPIVVTARAVAS